MRTEKMLMVQFTGLYGRSSDWEPELHKLYFVSNRNARYEFTVMLEDDDGDEYEDVEMRTCLRIHESYEDCMDRDEDTFIPHEDCDYILCEITVNIDDENNLISVA